MKLPHREGSISSCSSRNRKWIPEYFLEQAEPQCRNRKWPPWVNFRLHHGQTRWFFIFWFISWGLILPVTQRFRVAILRRCILEGAGLVVGGIFVLVLNLSFGRDVLLSFLVRMRYIFRQTAWTYRHFGADWGPPFRSTPLPLIFSSTISFGLDPTCYYYAKINNSD